ncbi:MAG: hypothetical protein Q8O45_11625 [Desulfurivibrionaceae bacterium]|nr:hypothetical protein [Desulfurivibrionaceae bacterium]
MQTAKKAGAGKSAWRTGNDVDFSDGLLCAKKRRSTSRESRSSFKEKGDKSCFIDFVLKQQACHSFIFLFFVGFCWIHGAFRGNEEGSKRGEEYNFFNTYGRKRSCFLFYAVVSPYYMGLFFCTSMWREFFRREG